MHYVAYFRDHRTTFKNKTNHIAQDNNIMNMVSTKERTVDAVEAV